MSRFIITMLVTALCLPAMLLLGCEQSGNQAGCGEPLVTDELSSETKAWWDYDREATYQVKRTNVKVAMRDGTKLSCALARPARNALRAAPGKFPGLVVEFTPYQRLAMLFNPEAAFFTRRGYNTLVCTMRGIGDSEGSWNHAMTNQENEDAYDLVEWLASQSFSDGRVGQFGESYGGYTTYGAAVENPPHLKAVAPLQSPGSLYHDVIYPGGIKATEGGTIDNWPAAAKFMTAGVVVPETEYAAARPHPTYDAFWEDGALVDRAQNIKVPVLTVGGWNDQYFRSGTLSMIEGALDRTWAIYGPFGHFYPVSLTEEGTAGQLPSGVLLAWFDHWVMELPNVPIPSNPTFVSYECPAGTGKGFMDLPGGWNPAGSDHVTYQLGADGTLAPDAPGGGTVSFHEPAEPTDAGGSASFTTAPLDSDRVLLGHSTLMLRAALSATDANFYAELIDVAPDGTEVLVNDGFLKASHRSSHVTPSDVTPGEAVDYEIDVRADHYRFAAGHSLRLRISGGPSDTLVPMETPVDVAISTGEASTLRLPGFAK